MNYRILVSIFYFLIVTNISYSQYNPETKQVSITGKVLEKGTDLPLEYATVVFEDVKTKQLTGGVTDFDGNFTVKPLQPGRYNIKASFVGYTAAEITGVLVSTDKITFQDLLMGKGAVDITAIDVTAYKNPIIDKGNPSTQTTITQEEIKVAPTRDVKSVAATTAGVYQKDEGDDVNVRGSFYVMEACVKKGVKRLV